MKIGIYTPTRKRHEGKVKTYFCTANLEEEISINYTSQ